MKYMGGKTRHAVEIINKILALSLKNARWVEPFIGGGSVITSVPKNREILGSDIDSEVVALFRFIQEGGCVPSEITEEQYIDARKFPKKYPDWFLGFVSVGCSFGGKKWGGYARGKDNKGVPRNYALETKKKLEKMDFSGISLMSGDYQDIPINNGDIVYCDPPYVGTTGYKTKFDTPLFWEWANKVSERACVFVSEYSAPAGWKVVWEKETASLSGIASCGKRATEKLFTRKF